jgi:hypothetical protein
LLNLHHHDRASLLAGKLHAVLQRPFLKGRDIYDLTWYLGDRDWPAPNLVLLNHALEQTKWTGPSLTLENWRTIVRDRIESSAWTKVREDALPFLASPDESAFLTKENLLLLLT